MTQPETKETLNAPARILREGWQRLGKNLTEEDYYKTLVGMSGSFIHMIDHDWDLWAREDQLCPKGQWATWLVMGGRGAGKTRTGAEWVRRMAGLGRNKGGAGRIALIGETFNDVREVMVEGVSGLLAVHCRWERPRYEVSRRRLVWDNGAVAMLFSAEDPEALRGPQFDAAWCDELGKWRYAQETWDMLQFGLRLGENPVQVVTTTPRPTSLLKQLLNAPDTIVTKAVTEANENNLAPTFLARILKRYQGTRLGRQELNGELIEDREDGLWTRDCIENNRLMTAPELVRIVVAVDPPVTARKTSDACGIIVAGLDEDGKAYVLEDATLPRARPDQWAARAVSLWHKFAADALVAEVNQGGDMVANIIAQADPNVPVTTVRATRGKFVRAEPIAALYAQERVHHVGAFAELEDEMTDFGTNGLSNGRSPDRMDALVWALTHLMLGKSDPSIRIL
jgi:phage terminase large subunit-like protein